MFFGLGLLVATLVALMVLPAVWHRAVRLTTRRIEAAVPVSLFEIQADKDQQRAAFALNQRRLELRTEELQQTISGNARTLEQHRLKIVALEASLATGAEAHGVLLADHAALTARLAAEVAALEDRTTTLAETAMRLATRDGELAETRSTLERTRADLAQETGRVRELTALLAERDASLVMRDSEIADLTAKGAQLASDLARTEAALAEITRALEEQQTAAHDAQHRADTERTRLEGELSSTSADLATQTQAASSRADRIAVLEGEVETLTRNLARSTQDLESAHILAQTLEHSRAEDFATAQADLRRRAQEMDILRADHAMMVTALENARAASRVSAAGESAAQLDVLREALADVAARIVAQVGAADPDLVAAQSSNSHATGPISLAERIQQAREELIAPKDAPSPAGAQSPSAVRRSAG